MATDREQTNARLADRLARRLAQRRAASTVFRRATKVVAVLSLTVLVLMGIIFVWRGSTALVSLAPDNLVLLARAFGGSIKVVGTATIVAVPIGFGAGLFFADSASRRTWVASLQFWAEAMIGVPAVVVGLGVIAMMAHGSERCSWLLNSSALALLLMPVVAHATFRGLQSTTPAVREAALALGSHPWRTLLHVCVRADAWGMLAAGLLAMAAVCGDIAPWLITQAKAETFSNPTLHVLAFDTLNASVHGGADSHASRGDSSLVWASAWILAWCCWTVAGVGRYLESKVR